MTPYTRWVEGSTVSRAAHVDTLTPKQIADLQYMREEEKLARDLYSTFATHYLQPVFSNIAASEQKHMDTLDRLLDTYQIPDPVWDNPVWVFTDNGLQQRYNDLLSQWTTSLQDALMVSIMVETQDIADLEEALAEVPPETDIARVYTHLLNASKRHFDAFTRVLDRLGYPIDQTAYTNRLRNRYRTTQRSQYNSQNQYGTQSQNQYTTQTQNQYGQGQ